MKTVRFLGGCVIMDSQFYGLWQDKRYEEGVKIYKEKVRKDSEDILAREALVLFLFMYGYHKRKKGLFAEAASMAKDMILGGIGLFGANMVIGYEKTRRGWCEESLENYNKALSVARDNIEKRIALTELAVMLPYAGRKKEAEDIIAELIDIAGITPLIRYMHVNVLRQQHRFREAINEYHKLTNVHRSAPFMEYVAALIRYSRPDPARVVVIIFGALYLLIASLYAFFNLSPVTSIMLFIVVAIIDVTISKANRMRFKKLR